MSNDRAVVKEYCVEEFGRIVALLNESVTPEERAAMVLELEQLRALFTAVENDADRTRRARTMAWSADLLGIFPFVLYRMRSFERQLLAERALESGRSLINEWRIATGFQSPRGSRTRSGDPG